MKLIGGAWTLSCLYRPPTPHERRMHVRRDGPASTTAPRGRGLGGGERESTVACATSVPGATPCAPPCSRCARGCAGHTAPRCKQVTERCTTPEANDR